MRVAVFDPFSGASGDMLLGALVDAGAPLDRLRAELAKVPVSGYRIVAGRTVDQVIVGTRLRVELDETADRTARQWSDIRDLIAGSALPEHIRDLAIAVFGRLAEAEARVHGQSVEQVHFHEVGGVDAIVDICGTCVALDLLDIEQVFSRPVRTGHGMVDSRHGPLPIPAPATALLLAEARAPVASPAPAMRDVPAELLTPTGAALLTTLARFAEPDVTPDTVAYGYGTKVLPWPNALRVTLGEMAEAEDEADENELLIETNIDDMNPQGYELLLERIMGAGAHDAWLTPVQMKKGRPGIVVSAIVPMERQAAVERAFFANSPTLGLRRTVIGRRRLARRVETVETAWGPARIKLRLVGGRPVGGAPEYDDVAAIARKAHLPFAEVWDAARKLADELVTTDASSRSDQSSG